MKRALDEVRIEGIKTNIPFHQIVMEDEVFKSGQHTTDFIASRNIVQKVRERERILSG